MSLHHWLVYVVFSYFNILFYVTLLSVLVDTRVSRRGKLSINCPPKVFLWKVTNLANASSPRKCPIKHMCVIFVMAALRSRRGHYIFALWFLLSSSSFSFLTHSQQSQSGCLPYMVALVRI